MSHNFVQTSKKKKRNQYENVLYLVAKNEWNEIPFFSFFQIDPNFVYIPSIILEFFASNLSQTFDCFYPFIKSNLILYLNKKQNKRASANTTDTEDEVV